VTAVDIFVDQRPVHPHSRRASLQALRHRLVPLGSAVPRRTAYAVPGLLATTILFAMSTFASAPVPSPAPLAKATIGGGCFWCTEAVFETEPGVQSVTSGYAGGQVKHPTYHQVCEGTTGHAEVIQIAFDPAIVSFERLLEIFWEAHDPLPR
jgi:hypothetical protein